ncbi:MAG: PHP domain-containing protein, partial [Patescibacteria group bacterium]|nr:PHP domain-containing protein [Patescibacteria group bacterium]
MAMCFTHLHCHSNFSLLDGVAPIPLLLERAAALGMTHLALTDHNNISGSVEFYEMARERGITPILGSEVTLDDGASIVLLVKNAEGYTNLCQLLTEGHLKGGHGNFLLSEKAIWALHRGLIALSGGKQGRITNLLSRRRVTMALDECHRWKSVFGKDFYLEMQWYNHEDILLNYKINDLAVTSGVGIVATNDVHFATSSEASLRTIVTAINKNTTHEQLGTVGSPEQYLKSPVQMHTMFCKYPRAVHTTEWIARQCEFEYILGKPIFPSLDLPQGMTADELLRNECSTGVKTRYGTPSTDVLRRLDYELETIISMGFAEYFLIVLDIVRYCRDHKIPCVGRGSAGDSLVAYVLEITQVDPVKYNLYFERFLNPERREPPDIDLDLCWKRRDDVIDYVYKKYGHSRAAMICTFNTFAMRSAVADVAKVYGCSEGEARSLTKHL